MRAWLTLVHSEQLKFRDPLEIREWEDDPRLRGFEDAFFDEGGVLNAKVTVPRSSRDQLGRQTADATLDSGVLSLVVQLESQLYT